MEPSLGRHVVCKVQRWALYLSRFNYVIEHIEGENNVFADIMTRWLRRYRTDIRSMRKITRAHKPPWQIIPSPSQPNFIWPKWKSIIQAQSGHTPGQNDITKDSDGVFKLNGRIWIPEEKYDLKLKIMVASHCGQMGHRGRDATESALRENFVWTGMTDDMQEFIKNCIHCITTRTGEIVPRPLGTQIHGEKPNEVLHADFLYMGISSYEFKYVLILRDDLSSYTWIWPSKAACADEAATALAKWISCFGTPVWLVTDQGSHFVNHTLKELTKEFRVQHHFTTAYSPWSNGSVERVCREVLCAFKSLLSEWKLAPNDWPCVTECTQSIINHAPLRRLGLRDKQNPRVFRTPLEVFTSLKPSRPLMRALPQARYPNAFLNDAAQLRRILDIDAAQQALDSMHKDVQGKVSASRRRAIQTHNKRCGISHINLQLGDLVLVRRAQKKGHKLGFVWRGPRKIIHVNSKLVFEVENMITKKREVVHARRLMLYRADMDGEKINDDLISHAEFSETQFETIKELRDLRNQHDSFEVLIEWEGLSDEHDWTWEPINNVAQDIPELLQNFIASPTKRALKREAHKQCHF